MSKSAMVLVPQGESILTEAAKVDLTMDSKKIYEMTSKLTTAQKLSLSALAIDRDMSELGVLLAEDALSQIKRTTCYKCGKIVQDWFILSTERGGGEEEGWYCLHCVDDLPYPADGISEDDYAEAIGESRVAKLEAKLALEKANE